MSSATPPARPPVLPWFAAAVAAVVSSLPFLLSLILRRGQPVNENVLAMAWVSAATGVAFSAGASFLVAQAHGERHGRLAFRRPAIVLALFALFLLIWSALQIELVSLLVHQLTSSEPMAQAVLKISGVFYPVLRGLGIWLTWVLAASIMHKDALPSPPANLRWRAAGLLAWTLASVVLIFMPMGVAMFTVYGIDYATAIASCAAAAAVPIVLAFAGAWLGLPRRLTHIHGWRLLGTAFCALASGGYLLYRIFKLAADALPARMEGVLAVPFFAVASALLCLATYWLWTLPFYAGTRRPPAA